MAKVINLNQVRKRKAKEAAEKRAEQNRLLHGMTRAEREKKAREKALEERRLEGHRLVDDSNDD